MVTQHLKETPGLRPSVKLRAVRHYSTPINIRFHPGGSEREGGSPYLRDTRGCRDTCRYADYMPRLHTSYS